MLKVGADLALSTASRQPESAAARAADAALTAYLRALADELAGGLVLRGGDA
jgi:hypothetical protein